MVIQWKKVQGGWLKGKKVININTIANNTGYNVDLYNFSNNKSNKAKRLKIFKTRSQALTFVRAYMKKN